MKASVILGHPNPNSFNHAIASTVREALIGMGWEVVMHDLYAEHFDPVMTASELARDAELPSVIRAHCDEIRSADGLVVVHPNWWSQPPAIVRGWTDRVLRPGLAYQFVPDGQGGAKPMGLLPVKAAVVFNTANTPQAKEEALYGDPLQLVWCKVVFGLCGIPKIHRRSFSPVITSDVAMRQGWLEQVRADVLDVFGSVVR